MPHATVGDLIRAMETVAPAGLAEPWDRVGLHVGSASAALSGPVLLTIDLTESVMAEAVGLGARAVVAYHPPIWKPLDRLTDATPAERIVRSAVEHGVAVYSPHTALDAAPGGVTDWLCEGIAGLADGEPPGGRVAGDRRALEPAARPGGGGRVKVVVFVPEASLAEVRNAMATAGAGMIGAYRVCSFAGPGEGTFLGGPGASPAVGQRGTLERVAEHRLEMVCARSALPLVVETLRHFHPYEEPAVDVYELIDEPVRGTGPGRRLVLDRPVTMRDMAGRLAAHLGHSRMKVAIPDGEADRPVRRVGVVPGAGGALIERAAMEGCEAFVTGEMKHHDILAAMSMGLRVLLAGHTNTERGFLPRLAARLEALLPGVRIMSGTLDRDPLVGLE